MEMNSEREKQRTIIGHDRMSDVCVTSRPHLSRNLTLSSAALWLKIYLGCKYIFFILFSLEVVVYIYICK